MFAKLLRFFTPADDLLVRRVKSKNIQRVSVYGMGDVGIAVINRLPQYGISLERWYDSKITTQGNQMLGVSLTPFTQLNTDSSVAIIVASEAFTDQIQQVIEQNGYQGSVITL